MADRLLVVDDNPTNLKLVRLVLEDAGFAIETATNAAEALRSIEASRPLVILMDVQLPDVDGLELTRRIKADPAHADIIILALTAYAMKGDEEKARAAGCDGYITKPIDVEALPRLVAKHLGRA